jgi:hypothetical protein
MEKKRAQVGIEYMIILAFVTFVIMVVLSFAVVYSNQIQDKFRLNQVDNFAIGLINSAEMVFFSGEPSKTTILLSLPSGVNEISIVPEGIIFRVVTSSGENVRLFESSVPLSGSVVTTEGLKEIVLTATDASVEIS